MPSYVLLVFLLIFGGMAPVAAVPSTPSATNVCEDVQAYLQELDQLVFEELQLAFADDDWVAKQQHMVEQAGVDDVGVMSLSEEDMQPFIDIVTRTGTVLEDYPAEDVPETAMQLHESSIAYWLILPEMMSRIANEGSMAGMYFIADLANAGSDNFMAREDLKAACPGLVEDMTGGEGYLFFAEGMQNGGDFDFENLDSSDIAGMGFAVLTFAAEDAN